MVEIGQGAGPEEGFDALAFIERYLRSIWETAQSCVDALREWVVDDSKGEMPFVNAGWNGIEEHAKTMARLPSALSDYAFEITRIYGTDDPQVFVVQGVSGRTLRSGEGKYRAEVVMFITLRGQRIAHIRDYANPLDLQVLAT
jgi:ketosteroid isomerase-like protein